MAYSIFARDGTSRIVLKRESREAAEKKARELTDLGWFEVQMQRKCRLKKRSSRGNSFGVTSLPAFSRIATMSR